MSGKITIDATGGSVERAKDFLRAYMAAPEDADIEIRAGEAVVGMERHAAVLVSINNQHHSFTADETEIVAKILEATMREFAGTQEVAGFPNLILSMRYGANEARAALDASREK